MPVSLSALQENIVTLLCYDKKHASIIRNVVPVELYGGPYREIARRVYEYIDRYKRPPEDHIADLFADKLDEKKDTRQATLYEDIILGIRDQKESINADYVMSQVELLVKRQSLRAIAIDVAKCLQQDSDESLEEAERLLAQARQQSLQVFDPGVKLSDVNKVLGFLDEDEPCFPTGIPELDKRGFGPTRKELWLFIAAAKRGKSWVLIQLAKMAAIHRLKVCHISLEMSQNRVALRYMQAFFGLAKRKGEIEFINFERDEKTGKYTGLVDKVSRPKLTLEDPQISEKLIKKIKQFEHRNLKNIIVKSFPTGKLTVRGIEAYLDALESNERFIPDLVILDYPDLLALDKDNYRLSIDEAYKDLRGLAVARNMAVAIVSQGNRKSEGAKVVGSDHVAEAWSKIAHADVVITYAQTKWEHDNLKTARLLISAGRNDEDKLTLIIAQKYATGAFSVDSVISSDAYWKQNQPKEEANNAGSV